MPWQPLEPCFTAACDGCGAQLTIDDGDMTPHFTAAEFESVPDCGWTYIDGVLTCEVCQCGAVGHQWGLLEGLFGSQGHYIPDSSHCGNCGVLRCPSTALDQGSLALCYQPADHPGDHHDQIGNRWYNNTQPAFPADERP